MQPLRDRDELDSRAFKQFDVVKNVEGRAAPPIELMNEHGRDLVPSRCSEHALQTGTVIPTAGSSLFYVEGDVVTACMGCGAQIIASQRRILIKAARAVVQSDRNLIHSTIEYNPIGTIVNELISGVRRHRLPTCDRNSTLRHLGDPKCQIETWSAICSAQAIEMRSGNADAAGECIPGNSRLIDPARERSFDLARTATAHRDY